MKECRSPYCSNSFVPPTGRGSHQKYCSSKCYRRDHARIRRHRLKGREYALELELFCFDYTDYS